MSEWQTAPAIQMKLDSWRGYSAYEIAVRNGFEGTEAEWLASLKGEKGEVGDNITVNNKKAVGGNVSINATDIYMQPGIATETVARKIANIAEKLEKAQADVNAIANQKAQVLTQKVALPVAAWEQEGETYKQRVEVTGVTIDPDKTSVIASPPADWALEEVYHDCAVRASTQGESAVVFACTDLPKIDLEANVMVVVLGVTGE